MKCANFLQVCQCVKETVNRNSFVIPYLMHDKDLAANSPTLDGLTAIGEFSLTANSPTLNGLTAIGEFFLTANSPFVNSKTKWRVFLCDVIKVENFVSNRIMCII